MTGEAAPNVPGEVSALLAALQFQNPDTTRLQHLSETEWVSLLRFCELAHMTLVLAQLDATGQPAWVIDRLRTNREDNALRFERVKMTYQEVAAALQHAGVDHIVIKGFTQMPGYVADPRLRQQSDLDLYCPPDQIRAAQTALESIGYSPDLRPNYSLADHTPAMLRSGNWVWRGSAFDPDMPLSVELHFCLWNEKTSRFPVDEADQFWHRRITRTIDGMEVSTLCPVDQLGHICLHILRNLLLRDTIIHHVYELACFLHSHVEDHDLWNTWRDSHPAALRVKEAIAFDLAQRWFGCNLPEAAREAIEELPLAQIAWLQRFGASACEGMFVENKDAVWLHLSLVSGLAQRFLLLRKTFFPIRLPDPRLPAFVLNDRKIIPNSNRNAVALYAIYAGNRYASYMSALLRTLYRGLGWRLSWNRLQRQFWIFLAASFFFDVGMSIYFFLFNLFLVGHGYTEKSLGLITGAMAAGSFSGAIPAARAARRYGLRAALLSTFVLVIILSSARALILEKPIQIALAFLSGVALSIWAVCISPAIARMTTEAQRPFAFSLIFSLGIGAGAFGGLAGGRLPGWLTAHALFQGIDPLRVVLILSCGIVAIGLWPTAKLRFSQDAVLAGTQRAFFSPFLLRFLPAIAVWGLVTGSFSPFANVYFSQHLRMPLPQVGNAFSLAQITQVAAVLAAPLLFRRWSLVGSVVFTQLAAGILLCFLAAARTPVAAVLGYAAFTAFQWMNEPALYSLLMDRVSVDQREGAAASHSLVMSASQAVAAVFAGWAFSRFGYASALPAIAVFALIAATMLWNGIPSRSAPESVKAACNPELSH